MTAPVRLCDPCKVGSCQRCVKAQGCNHPHDRDVVRKHGLSVASDGAEHGAPGPGRAGGRP